MSFSSLRFLVLVVAVLSSPALLFSADADANKLGDSLKEFDSQIRSIESLPRPPGYGDVPISGRVPHLTGVGASSTPQPSSADGTVGSDDDFRAAWCRVGFLQGDDTPFQLMLADSGLRSALMSYDSRRVSIDIFDNYISTLDVSAPYRCDVLLAAGMLARQLGRVTLAEKWLLMAYEESKDHKDARICAQGIKAGAEILTLMTWSGRKLEAKALLQDLEAHVVPGRVFERFVAAKSAVALMERYPGQSYQCGPFALLSVLKVLDGGNGPDDPIEKIPSTENGTSLLQLSHFTSRMAAVKSRSGSRISVPSIIHWRVGHFSAVTERHGKFLRVKDPTMDPVYGTDVLLEEAELLKEISQYALIPKQHLNGDWVTLAADEAGSVFGKGFTSLPPADPLDQVNPTCDASSGCWSPNAQPAGSGGSGSNPRLAGYRILSQAVSLVVADTPIWYQLPSGDTMAFTATYIQQSGYFSNAAGNPGIGPTWKINLVGHGFFPTNQFFTSPDGRAIPLYVSILDALGVNTIYEMDPSGISKVNSRDGSKIIWGPDSTLVSGYPSGKVRNVKFELVYDNDVVVEYEEGLYSVSLIRNVRVDVKGDLDRVTTYNYGQASNRLLSITDYLGQTTKIVYGKTGIDRLDEIEDPFGRVAKFGYDEEGKLASITDMGGMQSSFSYNGTSGWMDKLTTPYGITHFDYSGVYTSNVPDVRRAIVVTDPLGEKMRHEFLHGGVKSAVIAPEMVPQIPGVVSSGQDHRNSFFWDRKAMKKIERLLQEMGSTNINDVDYYALATQRIHWRDTANHVFVGKLPDSVHGPLTYPLFSVYSGPMGFEDLVRTGRRVWADDDGDGVSESVTSASRYSYTADRKLQTVTDPIGRTLRIRYDGDDITSIEQIAPDPSQDQDVSTLMSDEKRPSLLTYMTQETDRSARTRTMTDSSGAKVTAYYNDAALDEINAVIDDRGSHVAYHRTAESGQQVFTTPFGTIERWVPRGFLLEVVRDGEHTIRYVPDPFVPSRIGMIIDDDFDVAIAMTYDALDRVIGVHYSDGSYESYVWDRLQLQSSRSRNGSWSHTFYNQIGQPMVQRMADGSVQGYSWCRCGALDAITDGEGRVTKWEYDLEGRVLKKTFPDQTFYEYGYFDGSEQIKTIRDALGQVKHLTYTKDGMIASVSYSGSTQPTAPVSFVYHSTFPRPVSMTDALGLSSYDYDSKGRISSIQQKLGGITIPIGFPIAEDRSGGGISIGGLGDNIRNDYTAIHPDGRVKMIMNGLGSFGFEYDEFRRLTGVREQDRGFGFDMGYHDDFGGFPMYRSYSIGDDSYIPGDRPTAETEKSLYGYRTDYNEDDAISSKREHRYGLPAQGSVADDVWSFAYDRLGQLTGATRSGIGASTQAFGYDRSGNMTGRSIDGRVRLQPFNSVNQPVLPSGGVQAPIPVPLVGKVTGPATVRANGVPLVVHGDLTVTGAAPINPASGRLSVETTTATGGTTTEHYTVKVDALSEAPLFDAIGQCTQDAQRQYLWDAAGRLVRVTNRSNGHRSDFTYDGLGRRVRVVELRTDGVVLRDRWYLWVGSTIVQERDGANPHRVTTDYYSQGFIRDGQRYFYLRDHLGSVVGIVDAVGDAVIQYAYDPWGNRVVLAGSFDDDFLPGFTGHPYHANSGLWMTLFRAYDPSAGRWLSRDPIEREKYFKYADNNPINAIDPLGGPVVYINGHPFYFHGNSSANPVPHHVYEIFDKGTGDTIKYGISGCPLGKGNTSGRAARQVNFFNSRGTNFGYRLVFSDLPGRASAQRIEEALVSRHVNLFNRRPVFNKLPLGRMGAGSANSILSGASPFQTTCRLGARTAFGLLGAVMGGSPMGASEPPELPHVNPLLLLELEYQRTEGVFDDFE